MKDVKDIKANSGAGFEDERRVLRLAFPNDDQDKDIKALVGKGVVVSLDDQGQESEYQHLIFTFDSSGPRFTEKIMLGEKVYVRVMIPIGADYPWLPAPRMNASRLVALDDKRIIVAYSKTARPAPLENLGKRRGIDRGMQLGDLVRGLNAHIRQEAERGSEITVTQENPGDPIKVQMSIM